MRLPLGTLSTLAWRNLWRNHRRTLIMLAAIAVGVWAMIFMAALMRGMTDQMVRNGLQTLPGEVQVHQRDYRRRPQCGEQYGAARGCAARSPAATPRDGLGGAGEGAGRYQSVSAAIAA